MGHPAPGWGSAGILPACLLRQNNGRDVRRKAGETPALPARAKRHPRLFVFPWCNTVGGWQNHEIDTAVESHPNLAKCARL